MSNEVEFETGAIVKLKSGGPEMTVERPDTLNGKNSFYCQWFAGKKLERGSFPASSLVRVTAEKE